MFNFANSNICLTYKYKTIEIADSEHSSACYFRKVEQLLLSNNIVDLFEYFDSGEQEENLIGIFEKANSSFVEEFQNKDEYKAYNKRKVCNVFCIFPKCQNVIYEVSKFIVSLVSFLKLFY